MTAMLRPIRRCSPTRRRCSSGASPNRRLPHSTGSPSHRKTRRNLARPPIPGPPWADFAAAGPPGAGVSHWGLGAIAGSDRWPSRPPEPPPVYLTSGARGCITLLVPPPVALLALSSHLIAQLSSTAAVLCARERCTYHDPSP